MAVRTRSGRGSTSSGFDLFASLRGSRLLAVYLAAGPLAALFLATRGYGSRFLVASLASLALLGLYALVIKSAPGAGSSRPLPVLRPRLEAGLVLAFLALTLARACLQVGLVDLGSLGLWLGRAEDALLAATGAAITPLRLSGAEAARCQAALVEGVWLIVLPGATLIALGHRPAGLGFRLDLWWLALPLVAIGAWPSLAPLATGGAPAWPEMSPATTMAALLRGLAAEFFFRALLLTRLQALGWRPGTALVLATLAFVLATMPGQMARNGYDLTLAATGLVAGANAYFGLALGCLLLRSRSLAAGAIWWGSPWGAFPVW